MQITHEQARNLIQFSLDGALQALEKARLSAHLQDCRDCRDYAKQLEEVEAIVSPVMKKHWNARPAPLSIALLTHRKSSPISASQLLAIRSTAVGLLVLGLFFSAWQFVLSSPSSSSPVPVVISMIPTPSVQTAQSTNTKSKAENCELIAYRVQENDTLVSIASRFLISEDEIMKLNQLKTETLSVSTELKIPVCNFTPTGTIYPSTFTITYTPMIQVTNSTPAGKY